MEGPILDTPRLILRPWRSADFEPFAAMMAEPDTARFITLDGRPQDRVMAWRTMALIVGHWQLRGHGLFVIEEKGTGAFVGRAGPWMPEGWPGFEIGWGVRQAFRGRGYASEAAYHAGLWAIDAFGLDRIISLIHVDNIASQHVAERLGETPLGATLHFGQPHTIWAAPKAQWRAPRPGSCVLPAANTG
jgi:RimJ/RimL family protein N-acetyltransferase